MNYKINVILSKIASCKNPEEAGDYFVGFSKKVNLLKNYIDQLPASCRQNSFLNDSILKFQTKFYNVNEIIEEKKKKANFLISVKY